VSDPYFLWNNWLAYMYRIVYILHAQYNFDISGSGNDRKWKL
jgi:hypothetical protein